MFKSKVSSFRELVVDIHVQQTHGVLYHYYAKVAHSTSHNTAEVVIASQLDMGQGDIFVTHIDTTAPTMKTETNYQTTI